MNKYCYEIKNGKCKGYFKIYQARNGSIQLMMDDYNITLSIPQILDLNIPIFYLIDYNHDKFLEFYEVEDSNE